MATQVQWRGGSTAEHSTFTGAAREVTVDTQKKTLVVHDGSTAGGEPLLREDQANLPSSVTNGLSVPSANNVALSTSGVGRVFVDASGNVGVGAAPSHLFSVIGPSATANIGATSGIAQLRVNRSAAIVELDTTSTLASVGTSSAHDFYLKTNASERLRITSTGQLSHIGAGSAVSPAVSFNGSAPSNSLVVDSLGRVSIGSSVPQAELNVAKTGGAATVYIESDVGNNATTSILRFGGASGRSASIQGFRGASSNIHSLNFYTYNSGDSFGMSLTPTGLGIGTAPAQQLHVKGSSTTKLLINSASNAADRGVYFASSDNTELGFIKQEYSTGQLQISSGTGSYAASLAFRTAGSERARIDASGRLLVGTSTSVDADTIFQIKGRPSGSFAGGSVFLSLSGGNTVDLVSGNGFGNIVFRDGFRNGIGATITTSADADWGNNDYPSRLVFSTTADGASSPTERMRILSTGGVHCFSGASINIAARHSSGAGTSDMLFQGAHSASGTVGSGTESFRVYTNGNVQNTNNSYTGISDIKLKENIVDASSQWDDIKALQVRNYNFKEGQTHTQIGLIAQEVEPISPGLVYESPDRDEDGNDLGTVTKSVNYSVLYMKAVKALQEAMERIETLEAKVAALESA